LTHKPAKSPGHPPQVTHSKNANSPYSFVMMLYPKPAQHRHSRSKSSTSVHWTPTAPQTKSASKANVCHQDVHPILPSAHNRNSAKTPHVCPINVMARPAVLAKFAAPAMANASSPVLVSNATLAKSVSMAHAKPILAPRQAQMAAPALRTKSATPPMHRTPNASKIHAAQEPANTVASAPKESALTTHAQG
jgi:hypothetical protein